VFHYANMVFLFLRSSRPAVTKRIQDSHSEVAFAIYGNNQAIDDEYISHATSIFFPNILILPSFRASIRGSIP
jgi:hypothetical protein